MLNNLKSKMYTNLIIIILIIIMVYFFLLPFYSGGGSALLKQDNNIKTLITQKYEYDDAIASAIVYEKNLNKVNKNFIDSQENVDKNLLDKILPTNINKILSADEFSKLTNNKLGIKIENPQFILIGEGQVDKNTSLKIYPITFSISSTYDSFKSFLKDLEKQSKIYNISSLSFNTNQNTEPNTDIKYNLTTESYYLRDN